MNTFLRDHPLTDENYAFQFVFVHNGNWLKFNTPLTQELIKAHITVPFKLRLKLTNIVLSKNLFQKIIALQYSTRLDVS